MSMAGDLPPWSRSRTRRAAWTCLHGPCCRAKSSQVQVSPVLTQDNTVGAVAGLRGNEPGTFPDGDPRPSRDFQPLEFPHVHVAPSNGPLDFLLFIMVIRTPALELGS